MAVLAPTNDWQPPRDPSPIQASRSMDPRNHTHAHLHPQQHSAPRQSPDAPQLISPPAAAPTPPYQHPPPSGPSPYPTQQHPWQPSPQAAPFYPAYPSYFPQQSPLPHQHQLPHPPPGPYFDPNQHFAQWAYQQMMFNAQAQAQFHAQQQQQMLAQPQPDFTHHQRTRSNTPPAQQQQQQPPEFFQSQRSASSSPPDPQGFHPYGGAPRRSTRQGSSSGSVSSTPPIDFPQPPYARADAAGSSSSLNSGSSGGRSRKGSNPSPTTHTRASTSDRERPPTVKPAPAPAPEVRRPAKPSPLGQATYSTAERQPRQSTSSARPSSSGTIRPSSPTTPRAEATNMNASTPRPTHAAKRLSISKDDSQLGTPVPVPNATMVRSGGLKGRLRRALSFNAASALEENGDGDDGKLNSRRKALANASKVNAAATAATAAATAAAGSLPNGATPDDASDPGSPTTPTGPSPSLAPSTSAPSEPSLKGKSRARRAASLFNTKLNASTDNISLSSTVSSASVMIRKLSSMGRLARKNSLMSITGLFKDKDKDKDRDANGDGPGGKSKGKKGATAVASVTHATAEIDRGSGSDAGEIQGLSPAAMLVRQHTIRSNEEAARQKAAEEARARDVAAAAAATAGGVGGAPVPVWERGTAPRKPRRDVLIEEDEGSDEGSGSGSDEGSENGTYEAHRGWEDDDEEDVTIRVGGMLLNSPPQPQPADDEAWAVGIRRSVERTRRPAKGILKNANTIDPLASFTRVRSNSYNQAPHNHNEPGPLARIPSPDPDHIDGLAHPHPHSKLNGIGIDTAYIPPFTFEDLPRSVSPERTSPQPEKGFFNLTNMNSSAPALSTMHGHPVPPPLTHRSATTPAKRLAFAPNLSIYDTFPPNVYDRRSEPATCNRLTPALAQRIKEELNSYKMEEMEVHAASRIQCVHAVFRMTHYPAYSISTIVSPCSLFLFSQRNLHHPTIPSPPALNQQHCCLLAPLLLYTLASECKTTHNPIPQACTSPSEWRRPCSCFSLLPALPRVHTFVLFFKHLHLVGIWLYSSWTDLAGSAHTDVFLYAAIKYVTTRGQSHVFPEKLHILSFKHAWPNPWSVKYQ
ncbi:hypothetical protein K439DRAFT_1095196 [Ramaria rubella]|nr:hypothetical protein K439DRAFT_1095196 [Ramaria rubella]